MLCNQKRYCTGKPRYHNGFGFFSCPDLGWCLWCREFQIIIYFSITRHCWHSYYIMKVNHLDIRTWKSGSIRVARMPPHLLLFTCCHDPPVFFQTVFRELPAHLSAFDSLFWGCHSRTSICHATSAHEYCPWNWAFVPVPQSYSSARQWYP